MTGWFWTNLISWSDWAEIKTCHSFKCLDLISGFQLVFGFDFVLLLGLISELVLVIGEVAIPDRAWGWYQVAFGLVSGGVLLWFFFVLRSDFKLSDLGPVWVRFLIWLRDWFSLCLSSNVPSMWYVFGTILRDYHLENMPFKIPSFPNFEWEPCLFLTPPYPSLLLCPFFHLPFFLSISSPPCSVIHSELSNSIMLLPLFSKSDLGLAALISALLLLAVAYETWRKAYWDWSDPIHGHIQSDAPGCAFPSPPPFGCPCPRLLT